MGDTVEQGDFFVGKKTCLEPFLRQRFSHHALIYVFIKYTSESKINLFLKVWYKKIFKDVRRIEKLIKHIL